MVLITGGNGVVGSRLARILRDQGRSVRVLGLPAADADAKLREMDVEVRHGDVTRKEEVLSALSGVQIVFHLAAILSAPENPALFHQVNVEGTRCVIEAAVSAGVRHLICVSSISVIYPRRNPYSASKVKAEEAIRNSQLLAWTLVRPCLVLDGIGGGAEYRAFAGMILRAPWIFLPRAGEVLKRPLHVEDLAEALARMADNTRCFGKTYAVGGDEVVSLRHMAESILGKAGRRKTIRTIPAGPIFALAGFIEMLSRLTRKRISWLCRQSLDGLIFDAAPDTSEVFRDLEFIPRGFGAMTP